MSCRKCCSTKGNLFQVRPNLNQFLRVLDVDGGFLNVPGVIEGLIFISCCLASSRGGWTAPHQGVALLNYFVCCLMVSELTNLPKAALINSFQLTCVCVCLQILLVLSQLVSQTHTHTHTHVFPSMKSQSAVARVNRRACEFLSSGFYSCK